MSHAVAAMLAARSVAIVGASERPGTFGARMVSEVLRGTPSRVDLVNPRYGRIDDRRCVPSLTDLGGPPDLVLLGVGDHLVLDQLDAAAAIGARSAVIFGSLHTPGLRADVIAVARAANMAVCGGGCMGFVNVTTGLRATGYVERADLPVGPISLVTHSGSVFSALLRTRRTLGYRIAVSSGQELVTTTADYVEHALADDGTRLIALVLETVRDGLRLRAALRRAAELDRQVVLLAVGGSPRGAAMVAAHSGAVAGEDAVWEALCADTGALRVADLAEFTDTLELLTLAGRTTRSGGGLASVHDSGAERTLVVDTAHRLGVPFAEIGADTRAVLADLLDDGLDATNPLDVWGTGTDPCELFTACLQAMANDPAVGAVALAVDLVPEFDGDTSYPDAVLAAAEQSPVPMAVLTNLPSAIDQAAAARLRAGGVAVLEGTQSGLVALRHLFAVAGRTHSTTAPTVLDDARRARWRAVLSGSPDVLDAETSYALLADYGIPTPSIRTAGSVDEAIAAASAIGYPVVLKTDEPGVAHKSDVGGVVLGIADDDELAAAYENVGERLGPRVVVCEQSGAGVELSVGIVPDGPAGQMVVVAAGGVLVELLNERGVALAPVDESRASELLDGLRVGRLLDGYRGSPPADRAAVVRIVCAIGVLALELGDGLGGLDVNPVVVTAAGAMAVDALVVPRAATSGQKMA